MTRKNSNRRTAEIKAMMANDGEFLRPIVRTVIQEFLEAEMSETDPECPGTLNQFQRQLYSIPDGSPQRPPYR
jgi:hypothetical protein